MRKALGALLVGVLVVHGTAFATDFGVTITEFKYTPASVKKFFDDTVTWTNDGEQTHNVAVYVKAGGSLTIGLNPGDDSGPVSWFESVGMYRYHCTIHPRRDMEGAVGVMVKPDSTTHPLGTRFDLTWAMTDGGNIHYDIQVKDPGSTKYLNLLRDQFESTGSFLPRKKGVYKVRGRTERVSTGERSDWSPPVSLTVT